MKPSVTTTLLVHPHPLECEAVSEWLQKHADIHMTGKCSCLDQVSSLSCFMDINLIIVFAYKSERIAAQIMNLRKIHPTLRFLLLGTSCSMKLAREIIRSGVSGYIGIDAEPYE